MRFNLHHLHKRKRCHQSKKASAKIAEECADETLAPYPHPNKWIGRLDKTMVVIAVLGPVFNVPQILKIYVEQQAAGLALSTWVLLLILKMPWIAYAVIHKETPLFVASVLWALSHTAIVVGILLYG